MTRTALSPEFIRHLLRIVDIGERDLDKLIQELLEHWSESVEEFVRRRPRELQDSGLPNRLVYGQIAEEVTHRPVRAGPLSIRQIRRIIYG